MKDIFTGKVVWITGASSGIGEALVKAFTRGGSRVIASSSDSAGLARVAGECSGLRGGASPTETVIPSKWERTKAASL